MVRYITMCHSGVHLGKAYSPLMELVFGFDLANHFHLPTPFSDCKPSQGGTWYLTARYDIKVFFYLLFSLMQSVIECFFELVSHGMSVAAWKNFLFILLILLLNLVVFILFSLILSLVLAANLKG